MPQMNHAIIIVNMRCFYAEEQGYMLYLPGLKDSVNQILLVTPINPT